MSRRLPLCMLFILVSLSQIVSSYAASPEIAPTPTWVHAVEPTLLSAPSTVDLEQGVYYQLADTQIQVDQGNYPHYFFHYTMQIINSHGVEANSQLNHDFDPAYQQLKLHRLDIIRNGKRINKLTSANLQLLKREQQMDQLIYDGALTLNMIIDDVRVGDSIDYAYSIIGMNPVYKGAFGFTQYLNWAVPLQQLYFRLVWNKSSPLYLDFANAEHQKLQKITRPKGTEYLLDLHNIAALKIEEDTPSWYDPWGRLHISEHADWHSVARWGQSLYADAYSNATELDELTQDWQAQHPQLKQQASAALRFVQSEVRYLGIELGTNSHIPSQDITTLKRRYGDCKDKTVLLISLLRRLGIEAYPALVNTDYKASLFDFPASARIFDHVITYVNIDGQAYWLDPTRSPQSGSLDQVYQANYGAALVLQEKTASLSRIQEANMDTLGVRVTDRYTLSADNSKESTLTTTSHYQGRNADRQRYYFAQQGQAQVQQDYLKFIGSYYPNARIAKPLRIDDTLAKNSFSTHEYYSLPDFWQESNQNQRLDADFYANIIKNPLQLPDLAYRNDPLDLAYPRKISQEIVILFADDDWNFEDESVIENNPFFFFNFNANFDPSSRILRLSYHYNSKVDHVTAEDFSDYFHALEEARDYLSYGIYSESNEDSDSSFTEPSSGLTTDLMVLLICLTYLAIGLLLYGLWRSERRSHPEPEGAGFYPISSTKFFTLYFATLGIYGAYWFYRNFKYLKQQGLNLLPFMRGIFSVFFYFALWRHLKKDSMQRDTKPLLFGKSVAILCALLFLILQFDYEANTLYLIFSTLVCGLLLLPLVNYIAQINQEQPELLNYNSRWRPRNIALLALCLPLFILNLSSDIGLIPSNAVISGDQLLSFDRKGLIRKQIIKPSESIIYFYSEDLLSNQRAGNGFSKDQVFSYWTDDNGLNIEKANFEQVTDIEISWADDSLNDSIVTIERNDGSSFTLFVSSEEKKDKLFVDSLKQRWKQKR